MLNLRPMGQQAKAFTKMLKIQKKLSKLETAYENKEIKVVIRGGGLVSGPKIKSLDVPEGREDDLVAVLNEALKKAHERSLKKLQEIGGGLGGGLGA